MLHVYGPLSPMVFHSSEIRENAWCELDSIYLCVLCDVLYVIPKDTEILLEATKNQGCKKCKFYKT